MNANEPKISLDYKYLAKEIDSFIKYGDLFRLFEPEDVIEVLKLTEINYERFVTIVKHLPMYYDENIIIRILSEMQHISFTDNTTVVEFWKIVHEILNIPVLNQISSHIELPKPTKLSLSSDVSYEFYNSITFGGASNAFLNSKLIEYDVLRLIYTNTFKMTLIKDLEINTILFILSHNLLRYGFKFISDVVKNNNIEVDINKIIRLLIATGNLEGLKLLLENGFSIPDNAVQLVCTYGHIHLLKYFFYKFPNLINQKTQLVEIALRYNHYHLVDFIISFDPSMNINEQNFTPLKMTESMKTVLLNDTMSWFAAVIYNDTDYLKTLLNQNKTIVTFRKFIEICIKSQYYVFLEYILQKDFTQIVLTQKKKEKILFRALKFGCIEIIELTFRYLFYPDIYDYYHVLNKILERNEPPIIKALWKKVNFTYIDLITFMNIDMNRYMPKYQDIVLFMDNELKRINFNRQDLSQTDLSLCLKNTPVGCLEEFKYEQPKLGTIISSLDSFELLLRCVSGIKLIDRDYMTNIHVVTQNDLDPLSLSCRCGCLTNIGILINHFKFDINKPNCHGICPIHIACKYGHYHVVQYLFEKGCDFSVCNSAGHNAMDYAIVGGYPKIIQFLLDIGLKIKLDFCIKYGHYRSFKYLIENRKITKNKDILLKIQQYGREDVFRLLNFIS